MPEQLHLSSNELFALLRRVFEAIYHQKTDYEDLARQIVWLEMYGLGGIAALVEALPQIGKPKPPFIERSMQRELSIEAQGASAIHLNDAVIDLAIARAADDGISSTLIHNCTQPQVFAYGLRRIAEQGFYAAAAWSSADVGIVGRARISIGDEAPEIEFTPAAVGGGALFELSLVCGQTETVILDRTECWPVAEYTTAHSAVQLSDNYAANLANGVAVGHQVYEQLCGIADGILVEATDQSRHGAGE